MHACHLAPRHTLHPDTVAMLERHKLGRLNTHLGANHGGPLGNTAQGLTKVAAAAQNGNLEVVLVDVVHLISRSEHLRSAATVPACTRSGWWT